MPAPSPLSVAAHQERVALGLSIARGRAPFVAALQRSCPPHQAQSGSACWLMPADHGVVPRRALCGRRVEQR